MGGRRRGTVERMGPMRQMGVMGGSLLRELRTVNRER